MFLAIYCFAYTNHFSDLPEATNGIAMQNIPAITWAMAAVGVRPRKLTIGIVKKFEIASKPDATRRF